MGDTLDTAIDTALSAATSASESGSTSASSAPASPASASAVSTGSVDQSATPATSGVPTTAASGSTDDASATGGIPPDRHKTILEKARRESAEQARREALDGLAPDELRTLRPHIDFIRQHGFPAYRDLLNRNLAPTPGSPSQGADEAPAPDLQAADGTPAFSAPQLQKLLAWNKRQTDREYQQQLAPLQETHKTLMAQQIQGAAESNARQQFDEAMKWEGFGELKSKVHELMVNDKRFSLEGAYNKVFQEHYLPSLKARTRQSVLDELKTAQPSTTVTPSSTAPRTSSKPRGTSLDDRLEAAWEQAVAQAR